MTKIKLTKNELKVQRDSLKRFQRYLPTLQLKKQQLQMEVRHAREELADIDRRTNAAVDSNRKNLALFAGQESEALQDLLQIAEWRVGVHNVAGTDVPVFVSLSFV
ncbi:MAG: V-type ATP synthase subunit D, partial [Lentisphaerae bacterium]|nr:V-type ATP synthase subunit D [Lentisphaerota bacterium]